MIAGCLKSVKDIANEIILVDTGSSDNTKKIASEYTNNIYNYEWNDDFASARNEASACSTLAQFTGNNKKFSESYQWAKKSVELIPNSLYSMNLMAYSLLHIGKFDEAEKVFEEAIQIKNSFYNNAPSAAYDVDVPMKILGNGLQRAQNKIIPKS